MKRLPLNLLVFFCWCAFGAAAQSEAFDTTAVVQALVDKVSPGYRLFFHVKGDLDRDHVEDIVAIAQHPCTEAELHAAEEGVLCRKAFFLLGNGDGGYRIAAIDADRPACSACDRETGLDPFRGVTIANGTVVFSSAYGECMRMEYDAAYRYETARGGWKRTHVVCSVYSSCSGEEEMLIDKSFLSPRDFGDMWFGGHPAAMQLQEQYPDFGIAWWVNGDLNRDGVEDVAMVLERLCPSEDQWPAEDSVRCRKVVFLLRDDRGQYLIAAADDQAIECTDCGGAGVGDPYRDLKIENGTVTFGSLYGACRKTEIMTVYRYRKRRGDWVLKRIFTNDYNCNDISEDGEVVAHSRTRRPSLLHAVVFGR